MSRTPVPAWLLEKMRRIPGILPSLTRLTLDDRWFNSAAELHTFRERHGHWPNRECDDRDEIRLSVWLGTQRQARREQKLRPDRRAHLNATLDGWDHTLAERWERNRILFLAFVDEHGRWPRPTHSDSEERRLAIWQINQRFATSASRRRDLTRDAPGWDLPGTSTKF